jgi:ketosteroid isomerase-like protein
MRSHYTALGMAAALAAAAPLSAQQHDMPAMRSASPASDTQAVRQVVEALAAYSQDKNLAALDTLYAPDAWVRVIEGSGVNNGWLDYRDHHLGPELREFSNFRYRYYDVESQVRGDVAWAAFRYELIADTPQGHAESDGRGTVILERRGGRWLVAQIHTSGRRRAAR